MNCRPGDLAVIVGPPAGVPSDVNIGRFLKIVDAGGLYHFVGHDQALFCWHVVPLGGAVVSESGTPLTAGQCADLFLRPIRGETQTETILNAAHV